ncbi:MAG: 50S ribosomal protein L23 [Candidatus Binatia bacterium]
MKSVHDIIRAPLVTEKGTDVSERASQAVFSVALGASKTDIKWAVEKLFGVEVLRVRTLNYLGKSTRRGRLTGRKRAWKKAYVTLAEGQVMDLIEKV